jgi:hypothetical protein
MGGANETTGWAFIFFQASIRRILEIGLKKEDKGKGSFYQLPFSA